MNLQQTAALLALIAVVDRRHVDEPVVRHWHDLVGDLDFDDACDAVRAHRRTSELWLLPVHVISGVRRLREGRFDAHVAEHGDIEAQMLAAGVDPNDQVSWAREVKRRRQAALARPDAQRELADAMQRHPSNGGDRR